LRSLELPAAFDVVGSSDQRGNSDVSGSDRPCPFLASGSAAVIGRS